MKKAIIPVIVAVLGLIVLAVPAGAWNPLSISVKGSVKCTSDFKQVGHIEVTNPEHEDAIVLEGVLGGVFHIGQHISPGTHTYSVIRSGTSHETVQFTVVVNYPSDHTPRVSNTVYIHFTGGCTEPTTTTTQPVTTTTEHGTTTTTVCAFTCNPDCFPNCNVTTTTATSTSLIPPTTAVPAKFVTVQPMFTG